MNPDGYKGYRFLAIRGNIVTQLFKDSVERKDDIFVRKINRSRWYPGSIQRHVLIRRISAIFRNSRL